MSHPPRPRRTRAQTWRINFAILESWAAEHGHANVPQGETVDGFGLGKWVANRRGEYSRGKLTADRIEALESLPGWEWKASPNDWALQYQRAQRWIDDNDGQLPPRSAVLDGHRVGVWVSRQRQEYHAGKLPADRAAVLEALPGWTWNVNASTWERGFAAVKSWAGRHGHAAIPLHAMIDGFPVGEWVRNRRGDYRTGILSPDKVRALESVPGWVWNTYTAGWDNGISALHVWVTEHASAAVPRSAVVDGFPLGEWVVKQRQKYRLGRLDDHRIAVLEAFAGWVWTTRSQPSSRDRS